MLTDKSGHQLPVGGQGTDGSLFILAHETAVAFDISTEDSSELALHTHSSPKEIIPLCCYGCQLAGVVFPVFLNNTNSFGRKENTV
jgi:hypothetical protein